MSSSGGGSSSAPVDLSGYLTTAVANGTYGARRNSLYGPATVVDGDSITILGTSILQGTQDRNNSWPQQMAGLSMGRLRFVYNAALAGQASASMVARFDTQVAPWAPDTVIATIGTNDMTLSQAQWLANLLAYKNKCDGIGARLQLGEIWPTSDASLGTGVRGNTVRAWNKALRTFCRQNGLQPPIPWTMLADPATGGWPVGWSADTIHPGLNDLGLAQIGELGWRYLSPLYGQSEMVRPTCNGADATANGFLLSTSGGLTAPAAVSATALTGTGTLPAGTYSYKMTALAYFGESLPSSAVSATLSATGQITVAQTSGSPVGNHGFAIYRLDPASGTYKAIGTVGNGTYSFVDDGTASVSAVNPPLTNQSVSIAGWDVGNNATYLPGVGVQPAEAAFARGNKFRITPNRSGAGATMDQFTLTNAASPGQTYEASVLVQGDGNLAPNFAIRLYTASFGAQPGLPLKIATEPVLPGKVYLYTLRFTVPVTTPAITMLTLAVETVGTAGWVDFAEVGLQLSP